MRHLIERTKMGKAKDKVARILAAMDHKELDRVPMGEFFWTNFIRRAKSDAKLGDDFDPYRHWDLDMVVVNPNMDPHITGIQVIEDSAARKLVKTGFGATIERKSTYPMPHYADFDTKTCEQMEAFEFDDPSDRRRYFEVIDDQVNAVGDELNLGIAPWIDRVNSYADDSCVFGSVCEPHEMIWRIMGTENVLIKLAEEPDRMAKFIERIGDFAVGLVNAQAAAAKGKVTGLYVWGDIAYDHGMFFSPDYWRKVYRPQLARICDACRKNGLRKIYHGCGNATPVYDDMIAAGVDGYNPLEAKAGLDVVDLKRRYGNRWTFVGNINVQVLATNDRDKVLRRGAPQAQCRKGRRIHHPIGPLHARQRRLRDL